MMMALISKLNRVHLAACYDALGKRSVTQHKKEEKII